MLITWDVENPPPKRNGPAGPMGPQGSQGEPGPKGDTGEKGPQGDAGATGDVGPQGATGAQGLKGDKGDTGDTGATGTQGIQGIQGPAGPNVVSSPTTVSPSFGTAYAATVPTKPSFISAMIDTAYTVTVATTLADTVELRIGPNQAQVAAGTGGFVAATFRSSVTGIALAIGLGMGQRGQLTALLPTGWFWSLRRTQGTAATITSATDQSLG